MMKTSNCCHGAERAYLYTPSDPRFIAASKLLVLVSNVSCSQYWDLSGPDAPGRDHQPTTLQVATGEAASSSPETNSNVL